MNVAIEMGDIQGNGIHENGVSVESKTEIPKAKLGEVKLNDYMKECLDHVAITEGFQNYELKVDHGSAIGDGFVGLIYKVNIQELDSDKSLAVVLKFPPLSEARRKDFGAMEFFKRESFVYSKVLPAFEKFQREKNIEDADGFFHFPKCYFAEYNEERNDSVIIMEDLREKSCRMWSKFVPMNLEHSKKLVAALGRFHAISFALKAQRPEIFTEFKELKDYLFTTMLAEEKMVGVLHGWIDRAISSLEQTDVESRDKVSTLKHKGSQLVNADLAEPYAVIGHGDCWTNNMMFRYKEETPEEVLLLDWQLSRYVSPVLDLVHFIFGSTDEGLRANHYHELIQIYHESLKELLNRLGGDTEKQFPFSALQQQLKQFGSFGIIMAAMIIPISTTKNEELPDFDAVAENMTDASDVDKMNEMFDKMSRGNDTVQIRMRAALLDTIRLGYL